MQTVLTDDQLRQALKNLDVAWSALPGQGLVRVFSTGSFTAGLALLGGIAKLAERANHHPDAHLTFDEVELTLITHSAGGVTHQDVQLAQAIDQLV